jgi:tetratricopeptide (TPR) repeat protein
MYQRLVQGDHPRVALSLNNVAYCLQVLGRAAEALPKYEAALAMRERLLKGDHPDVANSLNNVADCLRSLGLAEEALPRYEAALEMYQRLFKGDHPDVALSLNNVALCLQSLGRAAEALPKCEAALEMYQRLFKGDHPQVALGLNNVAYCLQSLGRAAEALPQFEAALEMYRRVFKGDHPDVAMSLNNGAYSLESLGRSAEALPRYEAALEMYQRLFKGDHPDVALSLNNVALCLQSLGRAAEALPKCEAALEMYKRLFKGDHPAAAQTLNNVAFCLQSLGRSAEALPKFEEALKMRQRLFKGDHPDVAESLNNVAYCLDSLGTTTEALPKSEASLEMYQRLFRGDHPQVASSLNNVAHQLQALGRIPEALPKYEAALEMYQRLFKGDHPDVAMSLNNVAVCLGSLGRTAEALTKNEAALEMYRRLYEGSHPALAMSLTNNALMLAELGMHDKAVGVFLESVQVQWDCLTRNFPTLTSQQKQQYLTSTRSVQTEALSGLIFEGKGLEAKDGLRGALLSKQLLFEAARQENGALLTASARALPEWLALWQERERLRRQYATSALQGLTEANRMQPPGHSVVNPAYVRELANRIEQLEQRLRQGNPAYALEARLQQVTLEDVTAALRPGEALIEYIGYHPYDFVLRKWGSARYGAFILLGGAGQVAAVDLGEADGIDQAAKRFRMEVAGSIEKFRGVFPSRGQVRNSEREIGQASSALRGLVWKPLEKHLSGIRRVYVAPEGILGLVPFEALAKEDASGGWRYLAEECELVYLGTARDLGRLALSIPGKGERPNTAVLIGNPAFSAPSQRLAEIVAGLKPTGKQVAQLSSQAGSFLLGADSSAEPRRVEVPRNWPQNLELAQMIVRVRGWLEKLGWSVTTLTNLSAVEEAAQRVQAPRILQFATHGYLLNRPATNLQGWDNPLLRSMLLMAGVNTWQRSSSVFYWVGGRVLTEAQARTQSLSEAEMQAARIELADGILTAYEVTGMNLHGTELVNLTACETGLGEVTPDGVAGLRQAFLLAGTRALTMSMWEVPAEETTGQIVDFYDRWLSGNKSGQPTTRYGAFRAAQLAALARARREYGAGHPFYWAGVVFVGDPGDLPASSEQRPIDKSISGKQ